MFKRVIKEEKERRTKLCIHWSIVLCGVSLLSVCTGYPKAETAGGTFGSRSLLCVDACRKEAFPQGCFCLRAFSCAGTWHCVFLGGFAGTVVSVRFVTGKSFRGEFGGKFFMADFRYVAKSMDGKIHRGAMEAAGESALQQLLKEQGMFLITAREGGRGKSAGSFLPDSFPNFQNPYPLSWPPASVLCGDLKSSRMRKEFHRPRRVFILRFWLTFERESASRRPWSCADAFLS